MIFPMLAALLLPIAFSVPASAVSFINPPPPSGLGTRSDFGSNPVYTQGSAVPVAWTDTKDNGIPFSVVVLQVDYSKGEADIPSGQAFEYVIHNGVNLTSTTWVAGTAKNLSFSNVFVLDIFFQGDTAGRALSHWFNITSNEATASSTITSTTASSTTGSTTTTTSSTASSSTATAATTPPVATTDGGFTPAAKAGLAVGLVAVLMLGVVIGWLWSRRRRDASGGPEQQQPELAVSPAAEKVMPHASTTTLTPHELDSAVAPHELPVRGYYQ